MDDQFEKYIKENRQGLDIENPPRVDWDQVAEASGLRKKDRGMMIWKIAASFLLLVSASLAIMLVQNENQKEQVPTLGDLAPEYKAVEAEYKTQIDKLTSELDYNQLKNTESEWLLQELQSLEEVNEEYRNQIETTLKKEKLIKILIDQYEKKLKTLKRIELEINRQKNEENTPKDAVS
jgi:DNA gyrase/topoisomerase IV subunit A